MPKTEEEKEKEIIEGNKEENIYTDEGREVMTEEDEITDVEEGFMQGYEEGKKSAICQTCGEVLEEDITEIDFEGDTYRFCCEECADKFVKKKKIQQ